jgi:ubiquinone/menaquinone biosynthesis C-methylase UbiE
MLFFLSILYKYEGIQLNQGIIRWYFNFVYTPIYDFGIAQSKPYQRLQDFCINKLTFRIGDHVLCIGVGTGNEIIKILEKENGVSITSIDTSRKALVRAYRKALKRGNKISALEMDAHKLDFADETFDKVLCLHVMGFLKDDKSATKEIVRVLKKGGQFVATYPSGIGSIKLGGEIAHSIWKDLKSMRFISATMQCLAIIIGGIAYIPVSSWVKPPNGFYSNEKLTEVLNSICLSKYTIDEDKSYQDYVVWGLK